MVDMGLNGPIGSKPLFKLNGHYNGGEFVLDFSQFKGLPFE
jgi:hypothetical protein